MADPCIADNEAERKREKRLAANRARYAQNEAFREGMKAHVRAYYELPENKERKRQVAKAYYLKRRKEILAKIRTNADELAAKKRQYRLDNLEAARAKGREYARAAKQKASADKGSGDPDGAYAKYAKRNSRTLKKWREKNPEQYKAQVATRAARERGAEGSHSGEDIARIRKQQKDKCAYCKIKLLSKGHIDHIVAVSNGGTNYPNNLQLVCGSCNSKKNAKDPIEFAQMTGRLL